MGRLRQPQPLPWDEFLGILWDEIEEGTFVYNAPTPEEEAEQRERRSRLFKDSRVPWIVDDITNLVQWWDDAQDVVAFARWNKRLLSPRAMAECMRRAARKGQRGKEAFFRCLCPMGRSSKRQAGGRTRGWQNWATPWSSWALLLMPFLPAPVIYAILAGQVSMTFFGVGLSLGPLMGAITEFTFRGLDELGAPFGPEHNKYNQLRCARLLQRSKKAWSSGRHLTPDDWAMGTKAISLANECIPRVPETVFTPKDFPTWDLIVGDIMDILGLQADDPTRGGAQLLPDTYGMMEKLWDVGSALPGNIVAYGINDLLGEMMTNLGAVQGLPVVPESGLLTPEQKAMLARMHRNSCPGGQCGTAIADALTMDEWLGQSGRRGAERPGEWVSLADAGTRTWGTGGE